MEEGARWPSSASGTLMIFDGAAGWVEAQHAGLFTSSAAAPTWPIFLAHRAVGGLAALDVQLELDDDHREPFIAAGGQGVDAGDRVDALLDLATSLSMIAGGSPG